MISIPLFWGLVLSRKAAAPNQPLERTGGGARLDVTYTFTDGEAKTRKNMQYYEMLGSRAIWADGWTAVAWHKKDTSWDDDKWELYHTDVDVTQVNNLNAEKHPDKLREMIALWKAEAEKYNVLPLDDRRYERAADPGRPVAALPKKDYTFYPGTSTCTRWQDRSYWVRSTLSLPT